MFFFQIQVFLFMAKPAIHSLWDALLLTEQNKFLLAVQTPSLMFGVYTGYSYHTIISNTVPQPVQHCEIQRETGKPSALNFGICSISVYVCEL